MGEQAYDDDLQAALDLGAEALSVKLCEAAFDGNLSRVQELIKSGADPFFWGLWWENCLSSCSSRRKVNFWLNPNPNPNNNLRLEIFKYLYEQKPISFYIKDNLGNTPFSEAFNHKRSRIIKFLIKKGAKLRSTDQINDFFEYCSNGDV